MDTDVRVYEITLVKNFTVGSPKIIDFVETLVSHITPSKLKYYL